MGKIYIEIILDTFQSFEIDYKGEKIGFHIPFTISANNYTGVGLWATSSLDNSELELIVA